MGNDGRDESRPIVDLEAIIGRLVTAPVTNGHPVIVPVNNNGHPVILPVNKNGRPVIVPVSNNGHPVIVPVNNNGRPVIVPVKNIGIPTSTVNAQFNKLPLVEPKRQLNVPNHQEDFYKGKIRVIMYTEEELASERERCRQMDTYRNKQYKCEGCILGFDYEDTFRGHVESRHTKNNTHNMECNICKSLLSVESYKSHMLKHYRRFECCACGKRTIDAYAMETHYNTEHGDLGIRYDCSTCDFVIKNHNAYRHHKRSCMKTKKMFDCNICSKSLTTSTSLRVHLNTVHGLSKDSFKCKLCDKSYKASTSLTSHMRTFHIGEPAYCEICDKQFKSAHILAVHRNTHANHVAEKRYECHDCGGKFRSKGTLADHIKHEHLKLGHKCSQCSKLYRSHRSLKIHVKFKHENKSLPRNKICDHCGKGFTSQTILTRHIRTHTGERPHKCPYCPATFAHDATLYNHKKLVHKHKKKTQSQETSP